MTEQTTPQSNVPIPAQPVPFEPSIEAATPATPPRRKHRRAIWISITVAVVIILASALGAIVWAATGPTKGKLVKVCRTAVTELLKSPGSAQWPGDESVSHGSGKQLWTVTGHVDAQNGFGALLRGEWECDAERRGRSWHVVDANLYTR